MRALPLALCLLVVSEAPAAAACTAGSSAADLEQMLVRAETAFEQLDTAGFGRALDEAAVALPCLTEPVPEALAARYHADLGIRMYTLGDEDHAREAFSASKAIAPEYAFAATLVPPGHELRSIYTAAPTSASSEPLAPAAPGLAVAIDGVPAGSRPRDRAAIFQVLAEGRPVETAYLFASDPTPSYALAPSATEPEPPRARSGPSAPRVGLAAAGVGLAAGSAYVYGDAAKSAKRFSDPANGLERDELLALGEDVNQGVLISSGLGLASAAALGVAVAWPW